MRDEKQKKLKPLVTITGGFFNSYLSYNHSHHHYYFFDFEDQNAGITNNSVEIARPEPVFSEISLGI